MVLTSFSDSMGINGHRKNDGKPWKKAGKTHLTHFFGGDQIHDIHIQCVHYAFLLKDVEGRVSSRNVSETRRSHFTSSQSEPPSQQLMARTRLASEDVRMM
jgi:hypothetical protein